MRLGRRDRLNQTSLADPHDQGFGNRRHDEAFLDGIPREYLDDDVLGRMATAVGDETAGNMVPSASRLTSCRSRLSPA
jgi:hypothetical protein